MSDEKKHDDAKTETKAQISDESLEEIAGGGGREFKSTATMAWDNTKNSKWSDSSVDTFASGEEPMTKLTQDN